MKLQAHLLAIAQRIELHISIITSGEMKRECGCTTYLFVFGNESGHHGNRQASVGRGGVIVAVTRAYKRRGEGGGQRVRIGTGRRFTHTVQERTQIFQQNELIQRQARHMLAQHTGPLHLHNNDDNDDDDDDDDQDDIYTNKPLVDRRLCRVVRAPTILDTPHSPTTALATLANTTIPNVNHITTSQQQQVYLSQQGGDGVGIATRAQIQRHALISIGAITLQ